MIIIQLLYLIPVPSFTCLLAGSTDSWVLTTEYLNVCIYGIMRVKENYAFLNCFVRNAFEQNHLRTSLKQHIKKLLIISI